MLIGLDYETTGFNAYLGDRIFAFCFTTERVETIVDRLDWTDVNKRDSAQTKLNEILYNKNTIIAHNAKFEMGFTAMACDGILPEIDWRDTMIMSQMLRNLLPSHALDSLAIKYLTEDFPDNVAEWKHWDKEVSSHMTKQKRLMNNYRKRLEKEIFEPMLLAGVTPFVTDRPNYGLIPPCIMKPYQEADGDRCMLLYRLMWSKLKEDQAMYEDFMNEMRLLETTQRMEQVGIMVHEKNARGLYADLTNKLGHLEDRKKSIFGFEINLDSSDQLQKHLFGYIDPKKHEKTNEVWKKTEPRFRMISQVNTDSGAPSASKEALLELRKVYPENEALDLLLQWRAFAKGRAMVSSYLTLMGSDCIVHPNIKTNEATTGRQSISSPSMQNVAKEFSIKTVYGIPARRCFRPRPGYVYFLGDYSGIEMRMIINASGEKVLMDHLKRDIDYDVHSFNAAVIFGDEFTNEQDKKKKKDMRARIKDACFGLAYGASLATFAASIKKSTQEARPLLKRFADICPGICSFNKTTSEKIKKAGYITTAFGRKLYIWKEKAYTASNYLIQGDAAGTFKRAQNNIDEYLKKVWNHKIRMVLPVHDEIIIEFPRSMLVEYKAILHDLNWCMINMPEIETPLMTEWKIAKTNWQDTEGIEI